MKLDPYWFAGAVLIGLVVGAWLVIALCRVSWTFHGGFDSSDTAAMHTRRKFPPLRTPLDAMAREEREATPLSRRSKLW